MWRLLAPLLNRFKRRDQNGWFVKWDGEGGKLVLRLREYDPADLIRTLSHAAWKLQQSNSELPSTPKIEATETVDQAIAQARDIMEWCSKAGKKSVEKPNKTLPCELKTRQRATYDRDHLFLEWYEEEGSETFGSPAKIRDRWNAENPDAPINLDTDKNGRGVVSKAIQLARSEREQDGGK